MNLQREKKVGENKEEEELTKKELFRKLAISGLPAFQDIDFSQIKEEDWDLKK